MKKIVMFLMILLFSSTSVMAGNLNYDSCFLPDSAELKDLASASIVYFNSNKKFSVKNIVFYMKIYNYYSDDLLYTKQVTYAEQAPLATHIVVFGDEYKSVLKAGEKYKFEFTTTQDYDEDLSNNTGIHILNVLNDFDSRIQDLIDKLNKQLSELQVDIRTPGYMHSEKVASGKISSENDEAEIEIDAKSYVGWLDLEYGAKFEHKTAFYAYDIDNSSIEFVESTSRPKLFDLEGKELSMEDVNIVGEEYDIEHTVEGENIYSIGTPTNQNRVCALLVSGDMGDYLKQQEAVDRDVKIMAENLRNEKLGPKLGDNNIRSEYGIRMNLLHSIIDSMKGKCDKVYFYYSGGNRLGISNMYQILKRLSTIGASEYNILIDASYSGTLEQYLTGEYATIGFSDAKVTMITSCRDDKAALIDTDPKGLSTTAASYFSKVFGIVYGTEAADLDKDGYTSFEETYKALKKYDKEVNGNDLTVKQLPNLLKFDKPEVNKSEKKISFEGVGVEFSNVSDTEFDNNYEVALEFSYKDFISLDPRVNKVSGTRHWYIASDANNGDFEIDVEFQLDNQYENLVPMMSEIIGMVYRESSEEDWQPQYPSVYNKDDNTITCPGVNHFSQWAPAIVALEGTSNVDSKFLINNVEYGPNPFKNVMNFEFNLDKPESFSIEVVDITGRRFDFINTQDYGVGTFSVNLDGSKYTSGTYYCRLISDTGIRTIKLVKE